MIYTTILWVTGCLFALSIIKIVCICIDLNKGENENVE